MPDAGMSKEASTRYLSKRESCIKPIKEDTNPGGCQVRQLHISESIHISESTLFSKGQADLSHKKICREKLSGAKDGGQRAVWEREQESCQ